jgi:putative long chain acyl-CoA synthase
MEAIEPRDVRVPEWYEPNPGTAEETALVLLTGPGERLRASRITNRRLSVSALGTASACALTARDTVYCCAPIHHATGILVCVGGALAGGSRLAVASRFEPKTFWDEVRRYGASVVFYTGAMCRPLVGAPPDPAERHHPVRLFAGSGMPAATWRRLLDRFGPVSVVEFYASTEANAVLVNLSGEKIGSVGRPLPGGAELALAAYDAREGRRLESATGFARPCPRGGVGLLLARVERERGDATGRLLRGVFRAGDAWISTGDLFRVDADGDFWLADHAADVVRGREGPVFTIALEDVLGEVECVDLAAAYGVELPGSGFEIPVAAIALRAGHALDPKALRRTASSRLPREARPRVLRVLDDLPTTAGHRLRKEPLRREGVRPGAGEGSAFWLEPGADAYTPFDARAYERLQRLVASGEL